MTEVLCTLMQLEAQLHPITRTVLRIQLTITPSFTWKDGWVPEGWGLV